MKKIVSILALIMVFSFCVGTVNVYAENATGGIQSVITGMQNASKLPSGSSNIANTINNVIGLLQITGTGISVIVVTMLGIKYLLASPSEKADTKKMIMPILIGCFLLFGAVNLVAIIADVSGVLESASGSTGAATP